MDAQSFARGSGEGCACVCVCVEGGLEVVWQSFVNIRSGNEEYPGLLDFSCHFSFPFSFFT